MALRVSKGRPYLKASIPFNNSRKLALLDEFYSVCQSLRSQDIIQVSRGLKVSERTVRNWKYRETFPRWDIAVDLIVWDEMGRPLELVSQAQASRQVM